jgi:hypothetical protein
MTVEETAQSNRGIHIYTENFSNQLLFVYPLLFRSEDIGSMTVEEI